MPKYSTSFISFKFSLLKILLLTLILASLPSYPFNTNLAKADPLEDQLKNLLPTAQELQETIGKSWVWEEGGCLNCFQSDQTYIYKFCSYEKAWNTKSGNNVARTIHALVIFNILDNPEAYIVEASQKSITSLEEFGWKCQITKESKNINGQTLYITQLNCKITPNEVKWLSEPKKLYKKIILFSADHLAVSVSYGEEAWQSYFTPIDLTITDKIAEIILNKTKNFQYDNNLVNCPQAPQTPELKADFTINPREPTIEDQVTFTAVKTNNIVEYKWYLDGQYLANVANKQTWTWSNPTPGKHTVKLVVKDSSGAQNEVTKEFTITALKVQATAQRTTYSPGEKAEIKITTTYAGQPAPDASVNLTIHKPDGSTVRLPEDKEAYCCTNQEGEITITIQIPQDEKTGEKWTIEVTATYKPQGAGNKESATTQLELQISRPYLVVFRGQEYENDNLVLKPMKENVTVLMPREGKYVKKTMQTDKDGSISLLSIIKNGKGEIVDGTYVIKLDQLPKGDDKWKERWGTYNKYPMWNDKMPPSIKIQVKPDNTKELKHSITVIQAINLWIQVPTKGLAKIDYANPYTIPDGQNLIIVARSIEAWEYLVRSEVKNFLTAAGVNDAAAQKIAGISIMYGVDCGMCGDKPCPGKFMPSKNAIGMSMPADRAYTERGISIEYDFLGNLLHEFGHRVKEELLYDSGASLGGEHSSEYDPCPNLDTAFDEAFADLFPILVQSYSQALPSYVGLRYDRATKVYGRHSSGKTGDYIEARIAGLWVSMYGLTYSGKTTKSAAALRDIVKTSLFFKATYGRPARTIGEWLTAKAFLDPTTIGKIQDIVKPEKYDIPVLYALDMPQARGILRTQSGNGLSAFIIAYHMSAKLAPPSRLSYSEAKEVPLKQAGVSTFPLKTGDEIHATGGFGLNDGSIYIKKTSEQGSQNMLKIDISAWRESHIKLLDSNTLYISNNLKAHIKKIGAGIPGLKIKTDTATISAINSELLIYTNSNGTTVTVLEGQVTVEAQNQQVTVASGQQTLVKPGTAPTKPQQVNTSKMQKWWTPYQPQEQAQKPQQPPTPQSKPQDIIQQIIRTIQNIVQQLIRTITEIIQQISRHQS